MVKAVFGYALVCACSHQSERLALEKMLLEFFKQVLQSDC